MVSVLLGCSQPLGPADRQWINRASIDLRGVRPTESEWEAATDDPEAGVDNFVADPRFGDRVAAMWEEIYRTRVDESDIHGADLGVPDELGFRDSLGQEPLRLLGYVAANDLPWTTILTAEFTLADDNLATAFPIDRPAGAGWVKSTYTDDRPPAGVLGTNGFWRRYTSTISNSNRGRANAISRIFLCSDYLSRPIRFDPAVDLGDADAVTEAIHSSPDCVACHVALDPIASALFGYWWYSIKDPVESIRYYPEREELWREYTQVAPGFYGTPVYNLPDLATKITADPRFVTCAVEQAWSLLVRRDSTLDDMDALATHRAAFLNGGLEMRALARSIVDDPEYRGLDPDVALPPKMATAPLLGTLVEDLTGYRWQDDEGHDLLASDAGGYRTLAGGIDGVDVPDPLTGPSATVPLVQQRLAERASRYVVDNEPERLFTVDIDADIGEDEVATQADALWLRVLGEVPAEADRAALIALWADLSDSEGSTRDAWAGVLTALLRDPAFLLY